MGVTLRGRKPSAPVGEEFSNSWFRLTPLMMLVDDLCPEYRKRIEEVPDGLNAELAMALGNRLEQQLSAGAYETYVLAGRHEVLMRDFHDTLRQNGPKDLDYELPERPEKARVEWFAAFLQKCGGYDLS